MDLLAGSLVAAIGDALGIPRDEFGIEQRGLIRNAVESVFSNLESSQLEQQALHLSQFLGELHRKCIFRYPNVLNDIEDSIARKIGKKIRNHPITKPKMETPKGKTYTLKPFKTFTPKPTP